MRSVWAVCSGAWSSHWWLISDALRAGTKRNRKSHFYGNVRETAEQRAEFAPRFVEWVIIISVEGESTPVGDIARTLSVAHIGHPVSDDVNCSNSSFPSTFVLCMINGAVSQLSFLIDPFQSRSFYRWERRSGSEAVSDKTVSGDYFTHSHSRRLVILRRFKIYV